MGSPWEWVIVVLWFAFLASLGYGVYLFAIKGFDKHK